MGARVREFTVTVEVGSLEKQIKIMAISPKSARSKTFKFFSNCFPVTIKSIELTQQNND